MTIIASWKCSIGQVNLERIGPRSYRVMAWMRTAAGSVSWAKGFSRKCDAAESYEGDVQYMTTLDEEARKTA